MRALPAIPFDSVPAGGDFVYFLRGAGLVKVGFSRDLAKRLRGQVLAIPCRLELIEFAPGSLLAEQAIHARLAPWRHHGEWFRPSTTLLRILEIGRRRGFGMRRQRWSMWRHVQLEQAGRELDRIHAALDRLDRMVARRGAA